jgi:hypothetical protein
MRPAGRVAEWLFAGSVSLGSRVGRGESGVDTAGLWEARLMKSAINSKTGLQQDKILT